MKTYFQEVGREGIDWIDLAEDRDWLGVHANAAINLWVP
jgi:hypothetical protein